MIFPGTGMAAQCDAPGRRLPMKGTERDSANLPGTNPASDIAESITSLAWYHGSRLLGTVKKLARWGCIQTT